MPSYPTVKLQGLLVGAVERAYGEWTTRQGEKRPGGVSYSVFVVTDFAGAPVEVKVKAPADFGQLKQGGMGAKVELTCGLFARGGNGGAQAFIEHSLIEGELEVIGATANGKAAAAAAAR